MKLARVLGYGCSAALAGLAAVVGITSLSDASVGKADTAPPEATRALIDRGAYLARLGDCVACHSVAGAPAFSGGLPMKLPIGTIYTPNITPDPEHGIGKFTLNDFDRALRYGVSRGHTLYPAMPFPSYAATRPDDVAALYAYFMRGVAPSSVPNRASAIRFPLSMRWPLTLWRWAFAPRPAAYRAPPSLTPDEARGGYLVEALGHCGDCHTPRGLALQVKAQSMADGPVFASGARIDGWFAPSLRQGGQAGLAGWSAADIATFLKSGFNGHGAAFGSMGEVVDHSTQYLTDPDRLAIARYLLTLRGPPDWHLPETGEHRAAAGDDLYRDNCAACHKPDGTGYPGVFPKLAGNPVLATRDPSSLIKIILSGDRTIRTASTPAQFTMPAFDWRLSDAEVAELVTYLRQRWGEGGPAIAASAVRRARPSPPNRDTQQ